MPQVLKQSICDSIQELRDLAYDFEEAGNYEEAEKLYTQAWDLIPEPKNGWNASRAYADSMAEFFLDIDKPKSAKKFVLIALASEIKHYDPSPFCTAGKVFLELGQLDEAKKYFDIAFERGGRRAFLNEDPKYFQFYLSRKG